MLSNAFFCFCLWAFNRKCVNYKYISFVFTEKFVSLQSNF